MPSGRPFESDINEHGLTSLQELFCQEYCKDFHITNAAIRAGYSEKTAAAIGSELYQKPEIRARIKDVLSERRKEYDVTVERMQKEIARIAFANPVDFIQEMGGTGNSIVLKSLQDLPKRLTAAVKSIRPTKEGIAITFHDKNNALDMLAKHFGYYEMDNEQKKPPAGVAIQLPSNGRGDEKLPPSYEAGNTGEMLG